MVTLKSIPPGRKVPKFHKNATGTKKCDKNPQNILKEDFLLFTMVTLKSIPLAGKFRNSQNATGTKKCDKTPKTRFPPLHDGDLEIDPPWPEVPKFTKTRQILKEDFLLFTMVTLKSIPPGRKVPKFTKTRQILKEDFLPLHDGDLEIDPPWPESSEIHKKRDRY
ncbi:unnamed protein product [Clavelina lepadiformis]|uniref:Uncharacterized protein n=1 Tax=Clavelina lepadiformis TaxID=159417 RepID=A0ABP0GVX6_CLALP